MIDTAINHIAKDINQYLMRTFDLNEDVVVVSNILEQDGSVATHVNNKIVVSLVNIEKETATLSQPRVANASPMRSTVSNPPIFVNLYLMFASYFSGNNYQEGLKFISNTIHYLQGKRVFDQNNTPDLDRNISKLVLDIHNLDMTDLSNLWGILSGKYLPSILYKVRVVTVDASAVTSQKPVVTRPGSTMKS
jgi:hypothetical protein